MKSLSLLLAVAGLLAWGGAHAQSAPDLLKSKNCLGCHAIDKKVVGPAFKDVAAKFKDDKGAEPKLAAELKAGPKDGKAHPVKVSASDAELKTMLEYVLSQK